MRKFIQFIFLLICLVSVNSKDTIQPYDSILMLGSQNTFYGEHLQYGFLHRIKSELQQALPNVNVNFITNPQFKSELFLKNINNFISNRKITKIFLFLSQDMLISSQNYHIRIKFTKYLERMFIKLKEKLSNPRITIINLIIENELNDIENTIHFSTYQTNLNSIRRLCLDYFINFVDFTSFFAKYWENINIDNLPHSILTQDGKLLNEKGHEFVAFKFLYLFGPPNISSHNNLLIEEEFNKMGVQLKLRTEITNNFKPISKVLHETEL